MLDFRVASSRGTFDLEVAFGAPAGATTVIVGESGAGKTSILRLAAGLDQPHAGHIALDGQVYADTGAGIAVPAWRRDVGYLAQGLIGQAQGHSRERARWAVALRSSPRWQDSWSR